MPISFDDAVERAKLAAGYDGILSQYVYDRLAEKLEKKDRYQFSMTLVDLGIRTKSASANKMAEEVVVDNMEDAREDPDLIISSKDDEQVDNFKTIASMFITGGPKVTPKRPEAFDYDLPEDLEDIDTDGFDMETSPYGEKFYEDDEDKLEGPPEPDLGQDEDEDEEAIAPKEMAPELPPALPEDSGQEEASPADERLPYVYPTMLKVDSSNVNEIGYDEKENDIFVRFKNGYLYAYFGVPVNVWEDFLNAESKGKFVHTSLKGKYDYMRIE